MVLLVVAAIGYIVAQLIGGFGFLAWVANALLGIAVLFAVVTYADDVWNWITGDDDVACYYPATGATVRLNERVCVISGGQVGATAQSPVATATATTALPASTSTTATTEPEPQATYTPLPTLTPYPTQEPPAPTAQNTPVPADPTTVPQPTAVPTQAPLPTQVPAEPTAQPQQALTGCIGSPRNFDNVRYTVEEASLDTWFRVIFNRGQYDSSGGNDGQWSWANSLCLDEETGGEYLNFGNTGEFVFRQHQVDAHVKFAIMTTSEHKAQFMPGGLHPFSINIDTMDDTIVSVYRADGSLVESLGVSPGGGDITIILPDDGVRIIEFTVRDPNANHETDIWVGPYDRNVNINTIDAS